MYARVHVSDVELILEVDKEVTTGLERGQQMFSSAAFVAVDLSPVQRMGGYNRVRHGY